MPKHKGDRIEERVYKALWHMLIAGVGVFELRTHKTKVAKLLACGLIVFHLDAAVSDALDTPALSRRILESIRPTDTSDDGESEDRDR